MSHVVKELQGKSFLCKFNLWKKSILSPSEWEQINRRCEGKISFKKWMVVGGGWWTTKFLE
eukprot:scaffold3835_cov295-Chaetoceros_neogracile.AAC.10